MHWRVLTLAYLLAITTSTYANKTFVPDFQQSYLAREAPSRKFNLVDRFQGKSFFE